MKPSTPSLASIETKLLVAFAAAMLVVVGMTAAVWKMADDDASAARLVAHTHTVRDALAGIRTATLQIEYITQGYRMSGDAAQLAERDVVIAEREAWLQQLQQQAAASPPLQALWRQLRQLIDERLAIARQIERLRRTEGAAAANAFVATAPIQLTRERTYSLLQNMHQQADELLENRTAEQLQAQGVLVRTGALVALALLALLAASYILMRRQLRTTAETQTQAREAINTHNEMLELRVQERTLRLRESEDHLLTVINNLPALITYVDAEQRYVYANTQYMNCFAPGRSSIEGCTVREILGESLYAIAAPMIRDVLQGIPRSYDWQPFAGSWQLVSYVPKRGADQQVLGYYVLVSDITERKRSEGKIQQLNTAMEQYIGTLERTGRALKTLSAGNRSMLRANTEQELLVSMCEAIVMAGGYSAVAVWYRNNDADKSLTPMAGEGYPMSVSALNRVKVTWADNAKGQGAVARAIRTGRPQMVSDILSDANYLPWHKDLCGLASVIACPLEVGDEVIGVLAIYGSRPHAISTDEEALLIELADDLAFGIDNLRTRLRQQKIQATVYRLTHYDALTGLPNETQFTEYLNAAIANSKTGRQPFAVLQVNIDRLNEINDALGFAHGDQLLREFSARLMAHVPDTALLARLRGDEFAILLADSDADRTMAITRRLGAALTQPYPIADIPLDVSARIGVALYPQHGSTPHDLYRHVNSAVNQAKARGVGQFIFDPTQSKAQSHRLNMAGELRRAIENGDLQLYLQPKVDMASGAVCGAEGLVRWQHAERGLITPCEFIGLAENTGLIKPMTEWVLEAGLRLNHAWQSQGCALPIALNLSARNLHDENLLHKIRQLRAKWPLGAALLELEITESSVMEDAQTALQVLHSLREEGIALYIDDYGTGYSSLAYLQKLPVDYLKIDQSFVRGMSTSKDSALIVRSTIDLVHDLGRKAVAEGVETQTEWDQLAAFGCDFAQGYFIAKPMPAQDFPAWMAQAAQSSVAK